MRTGFLIASLSALGCAAGSARAVQSRQEPEPLRVWTARALATVLAESGREFERAADVRLEIVSGLPTDFARRRAQGERFDLLISGAGTIDEWIARGGLDASSRTDLARSGIGVAVRAGAPKPRLETVDDFRRALLQARSVAHLRVGSGIYLTALLEQLGVAQAIAAKLRRPEADSVSELVAKGEVELGLVVITQILTTPGVELAGPLPGEIQSYVTFAAAISSDAAAANAARELIAFLRGPVAARAIEAQGMERPPF